MEQWIVFLQERWFVILLALIAAVIILKVLQTILKWVLVIGIIVAVLIYGANYDPEKIREVGDTVKNEAIQLMFGDAERAEYRELDDGRFEIKTRSVTLIGRPGEERVTLSYLGLSIEVNLDERLQAFIDSAKQQAEQEK